MPKAQNAAQMTLMEGRTVPFSFCLKKSLIGRAGAAETYYRKPFRQLAENEYLSIVAMIIAPKNFKLRLRPEANAERTRRLHA